MYIVIVVCLAYLYLSLLISLRILMRNKKNSLDSMSMLYLYRKYRSLFDSIYVTNYYGRNKKMRVK